MAGEGAGIARSWWVRVSAWKANLLVFGLLFFLVVGYFYVQIRQAHRLFVADAEAHARLVAGIIRLHARSAMLTQDVIDEILKTFLGNTSRFVSYLDGVEPFNAGELSAFAQEAGLVGIGIVRADGSRVMGPEGWLPTADMSCVQGPRLIYAPGRHLLYLGTLTAGGHACVIAGIEASRIEDLQNEVGLEKGLRAVSQMGQVRYVRIEAGPPHPGQALGPPPGPPPGEPPGLGPPPGPSILSMRMEASGAVAEVRLPMMRGRTLVVGLDAGPLMAVGRRLWRDFAIFTVILAVAGTLLSWLLYRRQQAHVAEVKAYEQQLSRQREEASLGRSAAAIAHEIRNPLNAAAMGLQRLEIEAGELSEEHRRLAGVVKEAILRTNGIVTGLLNYARFPKPKPVAVHVPSLVEDVLALYRGRIDKQGIQLHLAMDLDETIPADPNLLRQVLDNLLRNALEAQPAGGEIELAAERQGPYALLRVRNGGAMPSPEQLEHVFEPYFTTKARGTGLGLSIAQRIVMAHGGRMAAALDERGGLVISVFLPMEGRSEGPAPSQMETSA